MITLLHLFFTIFSVAPAFSAEGGTSSHGGDAVVCYNQDVDKDGRPLVVGTPLRITSVELLDYWEWRQSSNRKTDLGDASFSIEQKVALLLKRIATIDPLLSKELNKIYLIYKPSFVDRAKIPDISDFTPRLERTSNCVIEQLAVQYKSTVFGQAWLQIDGNLYSRLSRDEQAGLVLHELLYRFALGQKRPPQNSNGLRYLNFIYSTVLSDVTFSVYQQIMADAKLEFDYFPLYEFYQVTLPKGLKEFGMDPANYLIPSIENRLETLTPEGLISLTVLNPHVIKLKQNYREASTWNLSEGDQLYLNLTDAMPAGFTSSKKSGIQSGPRMISVQLLGNSTCTYLSAYLLEQPDFLGVKETLNCEATTFATAMLSLEYQAPLPVSSYSNFLGNQNSISFGDSRTLFNTFPGWSGVLVSESVDVSGTIKATFNSGKCEERWCKFQAQIECLSESPSPCTADGGNESVLLQPGQSTLVVWKVRHSRN